MKVGTDDLTLKLGRALASLSVVMISGQLWTAQGQLISELTGTEKFRVSSDQS